MTLDSHEAKRWSPDEVRKTGLLTVITESNVKPSISQCSLFPIPNRSFSFNGVMLFTSPECHLGNRFEV